MPLPQDSAIKPPQRDFHDGNCHSFRVVVICFKGFGSILTNTSLPSQLWFTETRVVQKRISHRLLCTSEKQFHIAYSKSSVICLDFITVSASEVHSFFCHFLLQHIGIPVITGANECGLPALILFVQLTHHQILEILHLMAHVKA